MFPFAFNALACPSRQIIVLLFGELIGVETIVRLASDISIHYGGIADDWTVGNRWVIGNVSQFVSAEDGGRSWNIHHYAYNPESYGDTRLDTVQLPFGSTLDGQS